MAKVKEIWKDIPGYEDTYQVSNLGRVKSMHSRLPNTKGGTRYKKGAIMLLNNNGPYPRIGLTQRGLMRALRVHRLVALAFIPNPYNYPQVNHKDGIKTNNQVSNLEWCTALYNNRHSFRVLGRHASNTKLNKDQVLQIRKMRGDGQKLKFIADKFNTTAQNICMIYCNKSWSSIPSVKEKFQ